MVEISIIKAGKMDVMDRGQLTQILEEQGLAATGLTTAGGGLGGLTGVDYLGIGSVTRFGATEDKTSVPTSSGVGSLLGRRGRQAAAGGLSTNKVSVSLGGTSRSRTSRVDASSWQMRSPAPSRRAQPSLSAVCSSRPAAPIPSRTCSV